MAVQRAGVGEALGIVIRRPPVFALLTVDRRLSAFLVKGRGVRDVLAAGNYLQHAQWSQVGGWVLPIGWLDDVTAELELRRVPYRVRERP